MYNQLVITQLVTLSLIYHICLGLRLKLFNNQNGKVSKQLESS